jgi:hypothetical protein
MRAVDAEEVPQIESDGLSDANESGKWPGVNKMGLHGRVFIAIQFFHLKHSVA